LFDLAGSRWCFGVHGIVTYDSGVYALYLAFHSNENIDGGQCTK